MECPAEGSMLLISLLALLWFVKMWLYWKAFGGEISGQGIGFYCWDFCCFSFELCASLPMLMLLFINELCNKLETKKENGFSWLPSQVI